MKIEISEKNLLVLREVYNPIKLVTDDGEVIYISMRDSGFEITYEDGYYTLQKGEIHKLK